MMLGPSVAGRYTIHRRHNFWLPNLAVKNQSVINTKVVAFTKFLLEIVVRTKYIRVYGDEL